MPSDREKWFVVTLFALGFSAMMLAGCGEIAEEDRSVTWDASGEEVGFQHAGEGVFVASPDGGGLQRIFQPGEDVIATSGPLWAPGDKRLIFATARYVPSTGAAGGGERSGVVSSSAGQDDPNVEQTVEYTCWLRAAPKDGESPAPRALFTVACGEVDYVRINLAVRWHPRGEAICYIRQLDSGRHALFEFDLKTGESRRAAPLEARRLLFDWTPDGSHLVCVISGGQIDAAAVPDGIWLFQPQQDEWRHVAQSEPAADHRLDKLRSLRPTWTADGLHFAFVMLEVTERDDHPIVRSRVFVGERATGDATMLLEDDVLLGDLRWHPGGSRLALVRNSEGQAPALHLLSRDGNLSEPLSKRPVRRCIGWNADGTQLAYVATEDLGEMKPNWALTYRTNAAASDVVYLIGEGQPGPGRAAFWGMSVTFARWAPQENKLSFWATFRPTHTSSWPPGVLRSLESGDPAVVLDVESGALTWMPIHAEETVQVAHYYLLKRQYDEAWRWYEQARQEHPRVAPHTDDESSLRPSLQTNVTFFEHYCLKKLGRDQEAGDKLAEFRRSFRPSPEENAAVVAQAAQRDRPLAEWVGGREALIELAQDFYSTEVLLRLGGTAEALKVFQSRMNGASTDQQQFLAALVYSQLLLLDGRHEDYASLAAQRIVPRLVESWNESATTGILAPLLPLYSAKFLKTLPPRQRRELVGHWQQLSRQARSARARMQFDLLLCVAHKAAGQPLLSQQARSRVEGHPAASELLGEMGIDGLEAILDLMASEQFSRAAR